MYLCRFYTCSILLFLSCFFLSLVTTGGTTYGIALYGLDFTDIRYRENCIVQLPLPISCENSQLQYYITIRNNTYPTVCTSTQYKYNTTLPYCFLQVSQSRVLFKLDANTITFLSVLASINLLSIISACCSLLLIGVCIYSAININPKSE